MKLKVEDVLSATFDSLSVAAFEKFKAVSEQQYSVESHGVLLQPPTTKQEAEMVYAHCESREKCLLLQNGAQRHIVETNAPHLLGWEWEQI